MKTDTDKLGGRAATGTIGWRRDKETKRMHWHVRVSLGNGRRPWVRLDPNIAHDDVEGARAAAAKRSAVVRSSGVVAVDSETVSEWFKRFHAHKDALELSTVREMRGRFSKWVEPTIGKLDIRAVQREDIERVVAKLDIAVAQWKKHGPGEGRLSPLTAGNVWGDLQHAFEEAEDAKDPALRAIEKGKNPCDGVRPPERGKKRHGQILYSDELLALLAGKAVDAGKLDVPLYRRQVYAMAVYTKARSSELEALTADDVDLAHGTVSITKQVDRTSTSRKGTKQTKTKAPRSPDIEPNVYAFVEWLVKNPQGKGGRLVRMPPPEDRAELLRKDLRTVGVTRAALHLEGDPSQRPITLHDLRDTGLTHMAVRSDDSIRIQWAGGHTDFKTTLGYLERGRVEARRIGAPLPPLPAELFVAPPTTPASAPAATVSEPAAETAEAPTEPAAEAESDCHDIWQGQPTHPKVLQNQLLGRPQWELNPCYRRERPVS